MLVHVLNSRLYSAVYAAHALSNAASSLILLCSSQVLVYGPGLLVASEVFLGRTGVLVRGSLERDKGEGGGGSLTESLGLAGPAGVGRAGGETRSV